MLFSRRSLPRRADLSPPPVVDAYQVQTTWDIAYGSHPLQMMDVWEPKGGPARAIPGFIVIHGGGWDGGDKTGSLTNAACMRLAQQGYIAFNINYRLVEGSDDAAQLPNPAASNTFPTSLLDAQLAIRWVRAQSVRYSVDSSRIVALGFSAGGHLAAFLGVLNSNFPGKSRPELSEYSPAVACAIAHSAPIDLTRAVTGPPNSLDNWSEKALVNVEPIPENISAYKDASPIYHVGFNSAPMYLSGGKEDNLVPPEPHADMEAALKSNGVPACYKSYDGGHLFEALLRSEAWAIFDEGTAWALANAREARGTVRVGRHRRPIMRGFDGAPRLPPRVLRR